MTLDPKAKLAAAQRLINVVCGDPNGDGMTVTNVGIGYAEPGYHNNVTVWVLGNWNDKRHLEELPGGGSKWITDDKLPSRLFDALKRIGVEGEWLDEWEQCSNCWRIFRVSGDSYSWKKFGVQLDDGDNLCGDCALDSEFLPDVLGQYVNHPERCVTFCGASVLEEQGWTLFNPEHQFESGLHPGQTDSPATVFERIRSENPEVDVLFYLDESSQFYVGWSAFTKPKEVETE